MLEKARRECSDVSSSVRPYLTTLLSLAQVCEYGNVPFAKVRYVRQSKITSVLGDFAESKSMSSSVRSIAMQLRRKWHLEQMSAVAYAPLNTVFKVRWMNPLAQIQKRKWYCEPDLRFAFDSEFRLPMSE